jgi:hypothetical protein
MADRSHPALASVTIRRLVLPEAEGGHGLGDAIGAALARELGAGGTDAPPRPGMAQAIARCIADHPDIAGRSKDGGR